MTLYRFRVTLRHANGHVRIDTTATNRVQALRQVLAFEGAPASACTGILELGKV